MHPLRQRPMPGWVIERTVYVQYCFPLPAALLLCCYKALFLTTSNHTAEVHTRGRYYRRALLPPATYCGRVLMQVRFFAKQVISLKQQVQGSARLDKTYGIVPLRFTRGHLQLYKKFVVSAWWFCVCYTHEHIYMHVEIYICMYVYTYKYTYVLIYKFRYVRTVHFENTKLKRQHRTFMSPMCPSSSVLLRGSPGLLNSVAFPAPQGNGNRSAGLPDRCRRRSCWSCSGCRQESGPVPAATAAAAAAGVGAGAVAAAGVGAAAAAAGTQRELHGPGEVKLVQI